MTSPSVIGGTNLIDSFGLVGDFTGFNAGLLDGGCELTEHPQNIRLHMTISYL
jgi:hypothetical protein